MDRGLKLTEKGGLQFNKVGVGVELAGVEF